MVLTLAIPKFSIAGILCPIRLKHKTDINQAHLKSVVSVLFRTGGWNAPRRSSSRSLSGLMYDREFWMSSTVNRMVAGGIRERILLGYHAQRRRKVRGSDWCRGNSRSRKRSIEVAGMMRLRRSSVAHLDYLHCCC